MMMILAIPTAIAVLLIAIKVATALHHSAMERKLLAHPPERIGMEIKLPRDAVDSVQKMTHFYERLWSILDHSDRRLAQNTDVITVSSVGEGTRQGAPPLVKFYVHVPPKYHTSVANAINEYYGGDAEINEMKDKDDPFRRYINAHTTWDAYQATIEPAEQPAATLDGAPAPAAPADLIKTPQLPVSDTPAPAPAGLFGRRDDDDDDDGALAFGRRRRRQ